MQKQKNQVWTVLGVAITHIVHIKRLFVSDAFSPTGNTLFCLGETGTWLGHEGGGRGLIHNDNCFYIDISTTCINVQSANLS